MCMFISIFFKGENFWIPSNPSFYDGETEFQENHMTVERDKR